MSHAIIRTISISPDGVVTIKSTDNNVWPRDVHTWTMTYRHEHNPFTGKQAAEVEVMAGYEQGNFQGGSNKFVRQLEVLRHMPEYARYDWRRNWPADERTADYYRLLAKALATPAPRPRYVIRRPGMWPTYIKQRKGAGFARWVDHPLHATAFRYADDAEALRQSFRNTDDWEVVDLADIVLDWGKHEPTPRV